MSAGVFPEQERRRPQIPRLPRERGGFPYRAAKYGSVHLFAPPGYFGLTALIGTPITQIMDTIKPTSPTAQPNPTAVAFAAESGEPTTPATKSRLPTLGPEGSPQMVTAPASSTHNMLPSTCRQTEVGNTVCIGNPEGQPELPPHLPDDGHPLQANICFQAMTTENVCWDWIQETPTSVQFLNIQKGNGHACGIKTDQTIVCWGANTTNLLDAPPGKFVALTTGGTHSCALRNNGTAEC